MKQFLKRAEYEDIEEERETTRGIISDEIQQQNQNFIDEERQEMEHKLTPESDVDDESMAITEMLGKGKDRLQMLIDKYQGSNNLCLEEK